LIEQRADVAAVNSDGELPIDIAETEAMGELLEQETREWGIDCEAARSQEERQMSADTSRWIEGHGSGTSPLLRPHPRTGGVKGRPVKSFAKMWPEWKFAIMWYKFPSSLINCHNS
jgi:hypothetical protein